MDRKEMSREAVVRAEIALEIMNRARGLVSGRVAAIEADDPEAAEELRKKRRELLAVQNRIRVGETGHIEAVIAEWGPRVRDIALFWREL